jgi:hypothetical protein
MNPELEKAMKAYRAQGATDEQVRALYDAWMKANGGETPAPDTKVSAKNLGRSALNQALFQFGDEMGVLDRGKNEAFQKGHPIASGAARVVGGAVAPIAAALLGPPALATAGGAAAIGGIGGLLSGAGGGTDLESRSHGAALEGAVGLIAGPIGYGIGKYGGKAVGAIMDRFKPERGVARGVAGVMSPEVATTMTEVNAIAPGGASPATANVPKVGVDESRFTDLIANLGASPKAAAAAEADVMGQRGSLMAAKARIGAQMDALDGLMPDSRDLRVALKHAREVGVKVPKGKLSIQEVRDVLSQLRSMNPSQGVSKHAVGTAREAVREALHAADPAIAALDRQYAIVLDHLGKSENVLKTIQGARSGGAGAEGFKSVSGPLGIPVARSRHAVAHILDKVLTNKAGAADAVAQYITKPGGPELIGALLKKVPPAHPVARAVTKGITTAMPPAMRGLLFPPDEQP